MWVGLIILIVGILWLPTKKRRYHLRRMGGYEVLFPRRSSSQPSSPDISSGESSPLDDDVPVIRLPFEVHPTSPSSSEAVVEAHAGLTNSPVVEAFHRLRNRVVAFAGTREEVQRSPLRPRRQRYSRGVLFFLPAIFTPAQDIELAPATLAPSRIAAPDPSRSTSRTSQLRPPPEKVRYTEDLESAGDLRRDILEGLHPHDGITNSSHSSCEDLVDVGDLPSRPHSRSSNSSRSRSTTRPLISWDS
jgi:hypothetical protein